MYYCSAEWSEGVSSSCLDLVSTLLYIANLLFSYCNTPHTVTGMTLAELFLFRYPRTKLSQIKPHLEERVKRAGQNSEGQLNPRQLAVSDPVFVRDARQETWSPAAVSKVLGPLTYIVQTDRNSRHVHVDHLQPHVPSSAKSPEVSSEAVIIPVPQTSAAGQSDLQSPKQSIVVPSGSPFPSESSESSAEPSSSCTESAPLPHRSARLPKPKEPIDVWISWSFQRIQHMHWVWVDHEMNTICSVHKFEKVFIQNAPYTRFWVVSLIFVFLSVLVHFYVLYAANHFGIHFCFFSLVFTLISDIAAFKITQIHPLYSYWQSGTKSMVWFKILVLL